MDMEFDYMKRRTVHRIEKYCQVPPVFQSKIFTFKNIILLSSNLSLQFQLVIRLDKHHRGPELCRHECGSYQMRNSEPWFLPVSIGKLFRVN